MPITAVVDGAFSNDNTDFSFNGKVAVVRLRRVAVFVLWGVLFLQSFYSTAPVLWLPASTILVSTGSKFIIHGSDLGVYPSAVLGLVGDVMINCELALLGTLICEIPIDFESETGPLNFTVDVGSQISNIAYPIYIFGFSDIGVNCYYIN